MNSLKFQTESEDETIALGVLLSAYLPSKAVVLLTGNLGAGKTTLAKGILKGLGVAAPDQVSSPTYTLIHEYAQGDRRAYHIDLYRLDTELQAANLGLEEIFGRPAVVLVEWGERFPALMPAERYRIEIASSSESGRAIEIAKD